MDDLKPHCSICDSSKRYRPATLGLVLLAILTMFGAMVALMLSGCATQRDFEKEKIERRLAEREFSGLVLTLAEQLRQTLENQARTQEILKEMIESRQQTRDALGRFMKIDQNNKSIRDAAAQYPESSKPSLCDMIPGMESCKP